MTYLSRLAVIALALVGIWESPAWAQTDSEAFSEEAVAANRVIDLRVPAADQVQRLTLSDGSLIFGRVESIAADSIVFRSIAGAVLTVPQINVADLRVVTGAIVGDEFLPEDSHNTRLMFAPTARSLRRGEGYVGFYYILPFVQVGVTDRLSLGAGSPLVFTGDAHPVWFTPKLQLIARKNVQVAAGVIHITGVEDLNAGIGYGVTTLGSDNTAATIGLGYAYSGSHRSAILMVGGEHRASRRIKWITENWLWRGSARGFVSGGVRLLGEHLSADVSLVVPLVEGTFAFPVVSFAWKF